MPIEILKLKLIKNKIPVGVMIIEGTGFVRCSIGIRTVEPLPESTWKPSGDTYATHGISAFIQAPPNSITYALPIDFDQMEVIKPDIPNDNGDTLKGKS
ncbi:MAG TPA: hypothetical protein VMX36_04625 [Sedimentisphaerales bacterium]|nr:hypothetical protein [Sedimentisphaerales bacterium]